VITFIEAVPDMWDITTREGQLTAVARIGGRYVGYVLDPDARYDCAERLARVIGWDVAELCKAIDLLREANGLPYEVTALSLPEG
jgi:hypothetical protein